MAKFATLKDFYHEANIFQLRSFIGLALVTLLFLILIIRFLVLQMVYYETYRSKSDENRIKVQPIPPTRGLIFDRNGILIADNQPSYSVAIVKELTNNLPQSLNQLAQIFTLTPADFADFNRRLKRKRRPYEPVPIKFNLSETEIAKIAVNLHKLPEIRLVANLVRHYPLGQLTAHVVGYVGRINSTEEKTLDSSNYAGTHHIGKVGLEQFYEEQLHGTVGHQEVETNAQDRTLRVLSMKHPTPGHNLSLHLDINIQKIAMQELHEKRGSVVAIDPQTGGVITFASTPSFDPNLFVTGINSKTYSELRNSLDRPLFNRSILGQYPPGSTIKPFVALAGLHHGATNWQRQIKDPGFYRLKNQSHQYRDWKKHGHGIVNLDKAIVQSCDTYFYDLAHRLGITTLHDYLIPFGFGKPTNIDLHNERVGLIPSPEWKRKTKGLPWYPGETLITGIGQGFVLVTPLQLAVATATLANGGQIITPKIVNKIEPPNLATKTTVPLEPANNNDEERHIRHLFSNENWSKIMQSMTNVVHTPRGTAIRIGRDAPYTIAGKTGTSQVLTIKQGEEYDDKTIAERHKDHALFIGIAPAEAPKIVVAVLVENGGHGSSAAAPIARKIMDAYLLPNNLERKTAHMTKYEKRPIFAANNTNPQALQ